MNPIDVYNFVTQAGPLGVISVLAYTIYWVAKKALVFLDKIDKSTAKIAGMEARLTVLNHNSTIIVKAMLKKGILTVDEIGDVDLTEHS